MASPQGTTPSPALPGDSNRAQETPAESFEAVARSLADATASARELLEPSFLDQLRARIAADQADRACECCGCLGDCRAMP